jgi:hypothetical protein
MRIARFSLLGALVLGAIGCQEKDAGPFTTEIPPLAFVRYINAVPDTLNTTVRWVDQLQFTPMTFVNVPFRGLGQGNYQGLEAGSRRFKVFTYDPNLSTSAGGLGATTAQLADTTFTFQAGKYYTLLHMGYARTGQTPAQKVYIIEDQLPAAGTSVNIRAIHAGLVGSTPLFANVALTNGSTTGISAYSSRATGAFALQIAATGTTTSAAATLAPAGTAGTTAIDPVAGSTQAGSVMTAIAFPASVAGSKAVVFATPGIVFYLDRLPARTTTP